MRLTRSYIAAFCAVLVMLAACAAPPRTPFTLSQQLAAYPQGLQHVRFFADSTLDTLSPFLDAYRPKGNTYLMISAGGAGGAYGAGVITGWTKSGERPAFDLVTGVSAGALIAPFAFAGPAYDDDLAKLFSSGIAGSLNKRKSLFGGLFSDSLYSDAALKKLINDFLSDALLRRIAERHKAGARLLVATTNIDAKRSVIWDMGAIAASGHPQAKALFGQVLTASSSIPGVFPPQRIVVTDGATSFEELHVDGGVFQQIASFPEAFMNSPEWPGPVRPTIFAISNQLLAPEFKQVEDKSVPIIEQSVETLEKAHLVSGLMQTQRFAADNNLTFRVLYIERALAKDAKLHFDTVYMKQLYKLGVDAGSRGAWRKAVPIGPDFSE